LSFEDVANDMWAAAVASAASVASVAAVVSIQRILKQQSI